MLWRVSRPLRSRSKPDGFILPCQPALADRPPSGPGWLHEIKFDGYQVIARKDGDRVRLWARTTSEMTMTLRQIATKTALVVETILIVLVATAVVPLCLAVLGVANRIVKH
jgi:bifunctional non-homologous end joining protein LigD